MNEALVGVTSRPRVGTAALVGFFFGLVLGWGLALEWFGPRERDRLREDMAARDRIIALQREELDAIKAVLEEPAE